MQWPQFREHKKPDSAITEICIKNESRRTVFHDTTGLMFDLSVYNPVPQQCQNISNIILCLTWLRVNMLIIFSMLLYYNY